MMTSELPAEYAKYSAAQAAAMREMTLDAIETMGEDHPDEPSMRRHLANLDAVLALRNGETTAPPTETGVTVGRRAGSAASNQFGTFTVHAASEKQVAFLARLLAEKDLTGIAVPATLEGINKKAASALIDKLIDRPRAGTPTSSAGGGDPKGTFGTPSRPASDKQIAFIQSLVKQADLDAIELDEPILYVIEQRGPVTSTQASKAIEVLKDAPRKPVVVEAPIKAGAYRLADGRIVRVYLGQQSGKMLAAELIDIAAENRDDAWSYLGMATRFVSEQDHRLTVEECEAIAGASGQSFSWCCVCGRRLDDPNSVSRGIGPVCRAKQGGAA